MHAGICKCSLMSTALNIQPYTRYLYLIAKSKTLLKLNPNFYWSEAVVVYFCKIPFT